MAQDAATSTGGSAYAQEVAAEIGKAVSPAAEAVVGGIVAVVGAIAWQVVRDRRREIGRRYKEADLLGIELSQIAEAIRGSDLLRSSIGRGYEHRKIPHGVYSGLVSSGHLADFDRRAQELLYRFYLYGDRDDRERMIDMMGEVIDEVEQFKTYNAPGVRAGTGRLMRFIGIRKRRHASRQGGRRQNNGGDTHPISAGDEDDIDKRAVKHG